MDLSLPVAPEASRSASIPPIMSLASVRRILNMRISSSAIVGDNDIISCRVVSSCLWRRVAVFMAMVVLEEGVWG